jgi:hypothetical protein
MTDGQIALLEFSWRLAVLTAIVALSLANASPMVLAALFVLLGVQRDGQDRTGDKGQQGGTGSSQRGDQ